MLKSILKNRWAIPVLTACVVFGVGAGNSFALEAILDFSALAADVQPLLTTAITAAAGVGATVLAAMVCWRFFKRFIRG